MPYITQDVRIDMAEKLCVPEMSTPGELNYVLTTVVLDYLEAHELSYSTINDILGAMEGAKAEFYRRVAAPYEDRKIKQNGDVYP
jgi:hypothetical protein